MRERGNDTHIIGRILNPAWHRNEQVVLPRAVDLQHTYHPQWPTAELLHQLKVRLTQTPPSLLFKTIPFRPMMHCVMMELEWESDLLDMSNKSFYPDVSVILARRDGSG
jgi:hypothetical protein